MKSFIIFSVCQGIDADASNTAMIKSQLMAYGLEHREVTGVYEGSLEHSFIVPFNAETELLVKMYCYEFNQESYLVYNKTGYLVYADGTTKPLGDLKVTTTIPTDCDNFTVVNQPVGVCYVFG